MRCLSYSTKVVVTALVFLPLGVAPANEPPQLKYPGLVSEDFIYTKASFAQGHASTICETSRGLLAAWFGGSKEGQKDVGIWTSYHDGTRWSKPMLVANGVQHDGLRYPCWNPVLYQSPKDGPTLLFFKVGPNARDWWGEVLESHDAGRSFGNRRRLPEEIDGPVRSKPMLLADGKLLCPSSSEHDHDWRMHFEILLDIDHPELGTSWKRIEPETQAFQVIQPTLLKHKSGEIQALLRSKHSRIYQTFSRDEGRTWTKLADAGLPNPNSGIEALTLADGRHLLLYNHAGGQRKDGWGSRSTLNLVISDDGRTWRQVATVEKFDKGELSYPAMIQTRDGKVHMTYTWKRQRIRHIVIDPAKIQVGKQVSDP